MLIKPVVFPRSGYFGFYKQPHAKEFNTSIFLVSSPDRRELNIILTQPGSYQTAYPLASREHFREINIFATSYDINFVSDVYRLARDLKKIKPTVHTIFPESFPMQVDTTTQLNHIRKFTFKSHYDSNISIEYHFNDRELEDQVQSGEVKFPSEELNGQLYDIVCFLGDKTIILTAQMNDDIIHESCCIDKCEIHLPYGNTLYGGYTYHDMEEKYGNAEGRKIMNLFRVSAVSSFEEYLMCRHEGRIKFADYLHQSLL